MLAQICIKNRTSDKYETTDNHLYSPLRFKCISLRFPHFIQIFVGEFLLSIASALRIYSGELVSGGYFLSLNSTVG